MNTLFSSDFWTVYALPSGVALAIHESPQQLHTPILPWYEIIGWIYLTVVLFLIGRGLVGILHLSAFSRKGKRLSEENMNVIVCANIPTAFSFFNRIFIPQSWNNNEEREFVLRHEHVHVEQKHSWDLMLMEFVCAVQFFNPFVWLLRHEMRLNHEFLADRGALEKGGDATQYFQLVLQKITGKQPILVHAFNYSSIKHRIMMQLTKPAKRLSQARYLAFVPLALALTFSFAVQGKTLISEEVTNLQNTDQLSETPANAGLQPVQTSSKDTTRVTNQSIVSINDIRDIAKESKMPLIIVDGLEFSGGIDSIGRIPPEIIQSVLILKDSAAKAFYVPRAARAANDVIIIETNPDLKGTGASVRLLTDGEECTVHHSMRVTGNDTTYYVFNEGDVGKLVKSKNLSNYEVSVRKGKDEKIFSDKDGWEVQVYKIERAKDKSAGSGDQIFEKVEEPPYFQGGEEARIKYLMDNLTYPAAARDSNVQGTVYVSFVVEKDGSISNVEILRGIDDDCDKETIRVIKNMPKWIPGKQRGQAVRVRFAMPVKFVLGE